MAINMNKTTISTIILFMIISTGLYQSAKYELGEYDQVVITQFGKIVGEAKTVPGEYFKIPFIQKANYFKKISFQDIGISYIPTKDLKFIKIKTTLQWKIIDPTIYMQRINSYDISRNLMWEKIESTQRKLITTHKLRDLVGNKADLDKFENVKLNYEVHENIKKIVSPSFREVGLELNYLHIECSYPTKGAKP